MRGIERRLRRIEQRSGDAGCFLCTCIYEGETYEEAFAIEHPGKAAGPRDFQVNVRMEGWTREGKLIHKHA